MYDSLPRHRRLATRLVLWVKAVLVQLRLHGVVFIVDGSRVHDETQRQGQRPRQNGYSHFVEGAGAHALTRRHEAGEREC